MSLCARRLADLYKQVIYLAIESLQKRWSDSYLSFDVSAIAIALVDPPLIVFGIVEISP